MESFLLKSGKAGLWHEEVLHGHQTVHEELAHHLGLEHMAARFILTPIFFPLGLKLREPNFTLKRTFKVENTGQLQMNIETIEVSGYPCEGYGFKVVNCQEFALSANASKDIIIL